MPPYTDTDLPNPYDPTAPDTEPEDPSLSDVFDLAFQNLGRQLRVCVPGKVIAVNGNQLVDVQPLHLVKYTTGETAMMPIVQDVLVSMAVGTNYSVKLPVAVGDTGLVLFADRALDVYAASDGTTPLDPLDNRTHDLTDAIFVPGLPTVSTQTTDATTDLVLTNGAAQVRLLANGKVQIKNGSQDLLALMDSLLTVLTTQTFTSTILGPQPFLASTVQALAQIQTELGSLKV